MMIKISVINSDWGPLTRWNEVPDRSLREKQEEPFQPNGRVGLLVGQDDDERFNLSLDAIDVTGVGDRYLTSHPLGAC